MARSITYWMDIMLTEKSTMSNLAVYQPAIDSSQTLLSDLKSTSRVARWRLIFWVVACCAYAVDVVFDLAIIVMEGLAAKSRYGTLPWYVDVAKNFQYGDQLLPRELEFVYDPIDESHRIVTLASAKEGTGVVNIKVAKTVGSSKEPLDTLELNAFKAYMMQKKPAGIRINVISDDPDEVRLYLAITFDPLVLKADGEMISSPGVYPVEDAVEDYKNSGEFDGKLDLMRVVDFIQKASGVVSAYVISAQARYGANPFTVFSQTYSSNAGYWTIDPTNPLSTTTTYTANV